MGSPEADKTPTKIEMGRDDIVTESIFNLNPTTLSISGTTFNPDPKFLRNQGEKVNLSLTFETKNWGKSRFSLIFLLI